MSAAPPHDVVYPMAPGTLRQVPAVDVAAYLAHHTPHGYDDWLAVLDRGTGLVPVEAADRITRSGATPTGVGILLDLEVDQLGPRARVVRAAFNPRPNRAARRRKGNR